MRLVTIIHACSVVETLVDIDFQTQYLLSHSIHTSPKCALTVTKFVGCLSVTLVLRVRASVQQLPFFMVSSWSWSLHKPMEIYMGKLILGAIFQYMVSAFLDVSHGL